METLNYASILSAVLFGGIGTAVFFYGRKQAAAKPMVVGALLVAETYFVRNVLWLWIIGLGLTSWLWFSRND